MLEPGNYLSEYLECIDRYSAEDLHLSPICDFVYRMDGLHRNWLFCENHYNRLQNARENLNKSDEFYREHCLLYDETAGADLTWLPAQTRAWTISLLTSSLENFLRQMSEVVAEDLKVSVKLSESKMPLIEKYVEWMSEFGGLDMVIAEESYRCIDQMRVARKRFISSLNSELAIEHEVQMATATNNGEPVLDYLFVDYAFDHICSVVKQVELAYIRRLEASWTNQFLQRVEQLSRTTFAIDPNDRNRQSVWFFERVKGQYKEALAKEPTPSKKEAFKRTCPSNQLIIKSEIAKYMNVWNQLPHHVARGAEKSCKVYLKSAGVEYQKSMPNRCYWEDVVANAILFRTADGLFGRKGANPIGDTNIKVQSVAYGLAYLHYITEKKLNLKLIWEGQAVHDDLKAELAKAIKYGYDFLNSLGVSLISETAKSEIIWDRMKENRQHPFDMEVLCRYIKG